MAFVRVAAIGSGALAAESQYERLSAFLLWQVQDGPEPNPARTTC
jgi:hypothetical protein